MTDVGSFTPVTYYDEDEVNRITFFTTSLFGGGTLAELPINSSSLSYMVNGTDQASGKFYVEDFRIQNAGWVDATAPNLTCLWVDLDGRLMWGGIITGRNYNKTGEVTIRATGFVWYLTRLLQAQDYSTTWSTSANQAGAAQITHQILSDALTGANTIYWANGGPLYLGTPAATPSAYQVTLALPISQRQTCSQVMSQLANMGYNVGYDYRIVPAYSSGVPTATLDLAYPRAGLVAGTSDLVLDIDTDTVFTYDEEGANQANAVYELATAAGGLTQAGSYIPSITSYGYPLLQTTMSHTSFSSSESPSTVLQAYVSNDLALYAFPAITLNITNPLFAEPTWDRWRIGDDVLVNVPPGTDGGIPTNPRFPNGLSAYFRIVKAAVTIPEQGVPTVQYTLNLPPYSSPQAPPA